MSNISVSLTDEDHAAIKAIADEKGLTLSDSVKWVLQDYFHSKIKRKGRKPLFGEAKIDCEHPPSRRMHTAFGVYCDVCKEGL